MASLSKKTKTRRRARDAKLLKNRIKKTNRAVKKARKAASK